MRKIHFLVLLTVAVLANFSAHAQTPGVVGQQNLTVINMSGIPTQTFDARYQGIKGSPFLQDFWANGEVVMQNGRRFSNLPLKYDIYSEVLAAKRSASDSVLLNSAQISAFAFQDPSLNLNRNFRRLSYTVKGISDTQGSFFEVMHEGTKYALLRKYRKTIRKANYQGAYGADKLYDEFIGSSDLFLRLPDSPNLVEVKLNRKSLMAALGDRKAEAEKQVEQEKIDLKTEAGAIRLLELLEK